MPLELAFKENKLRKDLFFKLSVFHIKILPLRERKEDIEEIIEVHKELLNGRSFSKSALLYLKEHPLPGNCRQLINLLTRLGVRNDDAKEITLREVKELLSDYSKSEVKESLFCHFIEEIDRGKNFWEVIWRPFIDRDLNRRQVRTFLRDILQSCGTWKNVTRFLRIEKDYYKFMALLRKYDLK